MINFEIEDRQPKDVKKVWRHKRLVSKMSSSSTRIVQEQQQYMDSTRIFKNFRKVVFSKLRTDNLKILRKYWRHKRWVSKTSSNWTWRVQEFSRFQECKRILFSEYSFFYFSILLNILNSYRKVSIKSIDQSGRRCTGPKTLRVFCTRNWPTRGVEQIQR